VTSFSDTFDQFLEAAFALDPLFATATGNHDHDGRWADLSKWECGLHPESGGPPTLIELQPAP